MLYQVTDATVSVAGKNILNHIDFEISGKQKVAIVGRNGAGKTTFLHLLSGELTPDRDDKRKGAAIVKSRALTIGMLQQLQKKEELDSTIEELLLSYCPVGDSYEQERYQYEMEYDRLFTGFGFSMEDKNRKLSMFSGGEQTKIALIRLLLMKPDILLLDEPTNHLDIKTVEWLEKYMKQYEKAVIMVSHDRFFLNQVVDIVYELSDGKLTKYTGNYSNYRIEKQKRIARQQKAYERQQQEIKKQEELIERFKHKANKAAFARSRKKMLERINRIEEPQKDEASIFTGDIMPLEPGSKKVFETEHLKVGYDRVLYELSFCLRRGQKVAILGENGAGKSTLLKTIAGIIEPVKGRVRFGNNIVTGYFDQNTAQFLSDGNTESVSKNVLEHFREIFPSLTEKEARGILGAYLFKGKDSFKKVKDLSGGEKTRLVLAELLQNRPNFLILDEPTNHCDIQTKETLESAFKAYKGTMLFVSHDRYFVKQIADAILMIQGDKILYYPFGYEHYLEQAAKNATGNPAACRTAEEQMLISGLKAVPEAEKHRLKEISTEEAYRDWIFRPVREKLEKAENNVYQLTKELEKARKDWYETKEFWNTCFVSETYGKVTEREENKEGYKETYKETDIKIQQLEQELEIAENIWHECCLEWYDIWLENVEEEQIEAKI